MVLILSFYNNLPSNQQEQYDTFYIVLLEIVFYRPQRKEWKETQSKIKDLELELEETK